MKHSSSTATFNNYNEHSVICTQKGMHKGSKYHPSAHFISETTECISLNLVLGVYTTSSCQTNIIPLIYESQLN